MRRPRESAAADRPIASVIIPTVNRPELLYAALGSVAAQKIRGEVEVIVVNDGGSSVAPAIEAWKSTLTIKLLESSRRSGPAAARNVAIEHADGEYLALLDDDDLFMPGHLAIGCRPLRDGVADFVYLGAIIADRRLDGPGAALANPSRFRAKAYPYDRRFLLVANYLHTGSVIVRNFKDTGIRFDESLEVCEDWDLWLALTEELGYRVRFLDKITSVYHQIPEVSGLVAGAQLTSPSKFSLARDYINTKWPTSDPLVLAWREWMVALEHVRDDLIASHQRMPNLLFDEILSYLHEMITRRQLPDHADITRFFADAHAAPSTS